MSRSASSGRIEPAQPDGLDGHVGDLLPYRLNRLVDGWNRELARRLRQAGYGFPEWRILAVLGDGDGLTMNGLVERTLMPQSTISRQVDRMAAGGLVERRIDPDDRRSVTLHITRKGRAAFDVMWPIAKEVSQEALAPLDASAQTALRRLVDRLLGGAGC